MQALFHFIIGQALFMSTYRLFIRHLKALLLKKASCPFAYGSFQHCQFLLLCDSLLSRIKQTGNPLSLKSAVNVEDIDITLPGQGANTQQLLPFPHRQEMIILNPPQPCGLLSGTGSSGLEFCLNILRSTNPHHCLSK